jgi:hypothetical protein
VERTFFDIPNLTLHFTQVVSRILFYNEMLINFDHDANRITLGGSPKSKVCRHLKAERQFALKERRKQEKKAFGCRQTWRLAKSVFSHHHLGLVCFLVLFLGTEV